MRFHRHFEKDANKTDASLYARSTIEVVAVLSHKEIYQSQLIIFLVFDCDWSIF